MRPIEEAATSMAAAVIGGLALAPTGEAHPGKASGRNLRGG
jgi:hypothetical protein